MFHRKRQSAVSEGQAGRTGGAWLPSTREEVGQKKGSLASRHMVSLFPPGHGLRRVCPPAWPDTCPLRGECTALLCLSQSLTRTFICSLL